MTLVYNGVQYQVESEGDIEPINVLAEDENEDITQASDNNSKKFQESNWTPKVMHLFLDECIKRKMLIRDPKIQKHKVFYAIHRQLKAKGYNFKVITLERKLRTMKRHYIVVSKNNQNPLLKRSYWQYYEKLKTLYPDCLGQELNENEQLEEIVQTSPSPSPSASSSPVPLDSLCEKQRPDNTFSNTASPESSIAQLILKDYSSSALTALGYGRREKQKTNQGNDQFENPNTIENLRQEILSLEERRTEATEKILLELRNSNKLKAEMLELNIQLFEATKNTDEY